MVDSLILKLHGDRPSTTLLAQQLEAQLLTCARTDVDPLTAETIEFLCDCPLNWPTVLQLAERNEVSQLLYQSLKDTCPDQVPTDVLETLQQRQYMHVLKSCYLAQELVHLLHRLTDANIPALAYKGPALASALYGNLALRPFCDLDILIHPDDLVPAKNVLIAEGYDTLTINNRLEAANQWSDSERDFVRQDSRVVVDLHWRLAPRFFAIALPVDELWERRQSVSLLGTSVPSLAPEDLLLALCIHGAKECWSKLKWVCDIAQLLRCYPQLNWEQVVRQAKQNHAYRMLLLGVALAKNIMGATLSESMNGSIQRDRSVSKLVQHACLYMFGTPASSSAELFVETLAPKPARPTRRFSPTRFRLAVCDRWIDQVQYVVWRILVPNVRDRQRVVLPPPLSFLYYLIRPLRLMGEQLGWVERPQLGSTNNQHRPLKTPQGLPSLTSDRPQIRTDLDIYQLGNERIIYYSSYELGIALNPSSSMIWDCCDGTHTLEDMGVMISRQVGCRPEAIIEDIWITVLEFRRLRLLVDHE